MERWAMPAMVTDIWSASSLPDGDSASLPFLEQIDSVGLADWTHMAQHDKSLKCNYERSAVFYSHACDSQVEQDDKRWSQVLRVFRCSISTSLQGHTTSLFTDEVLYRKGFKIFVAITVKKVDGKEGQCRWVVMSDIISVSIPSRNCGHLHTECLVVHTLHCTELPCPREVVVPTRIWGVEIETPWKRCF